jgi:hypothetical protein
MMEFVDWIHMVQNTDRLRALMKALMGIRVSKKVGHILAR